MTAYATTSTCAGRCAVYAAPAGAGRKRRGRWLFVSHDGVAGAAVGRAVAALAAEATAWPAGERWTVSLKFEPPIAHVRCATLAAARRLVRVCHASGWRETGCNLADVPTVAVRSTGAALDCPLGEGARENPAAEQPRRFSPELNSRWYALSMPSLKVTTKVTSSHLFRWAVGD